MHSKHFKDLLMTSWRQSCLQFILEAKHSWSFFPATWVNFFLCKKQLERRLWRMVLDVWHKQFVSSPLLAIRSLFQRTHSARHGGNSLANDGHNDGRLLTINRYFRWKALFLSVAKGSERCEFWNRILRGLFPPVKTFTNHKIFIHEKLIYFPYN